MSKWNIRLSSSLGQKKVEKKVEFLKKKVKHRSRDLEAVFLLGWMVRWWLDIAACMYMCVYAGMHVWCVYAGMHASSVYACMHVWCVMYICICVYEYIHVCMHICIPACICLPTCMHVYAYMHAYVCLHACVYMFTCMCVYAYMHAHVCSHACTCMLTCTHVYTYMHTCVCLHACMCMLTCMCVYVYKHVYADMHASVCLHACTNAPLDTCQYPSCIIHTLACTFRPVENFWQAKKPKSSKSKHPSMHILNILFKTSLKLKRGQLVTPITYTSARACRCLTTGCHLDKRKTMVRNNVEQQPIIWQCEKRYKDSNVNLENKIIWHTGSRTTEEKQKYQRKIKYYHENEQEFTDIMSQKKLPILELEEEGVTWDVNFNQAFWRNFKSAIPKIEWNWRKIKCSKGKCTIPDIKAQSCES